MLDRWKINLTILWFGQFFVVAGMSMIIPFLPLYIQELGVTDSDKISFWAGIIFASNFVTAFFFQPFWGKLADRHGRKLMIIRSGIGMSIVMMLMGFSSTVWHLFILRIINGMISGFVPAATALLSASTPRKHIGMAMGTLQSGAVAGTILGPVLSGLMVNAVGYRPIFYITGTLIFIATVLCIFLVKEDFDKEKAKQQPNLSVLAGLNDLRKIPQLPALYAVTFLIQFSIVGTMPQIPLYIQKMLISPEWLAFYAGLITSITGISNMVASPIWGKIGDRVGSHKILFIALVGSSLVFIPHAMAANVWQLMVVRFALGLFIGGLLPSVNALIRQFTPSGMESRAYGFNTSSLALGNMLGPLISGALVGFTGIPFVFILSSILLALNSIWVYMTLLKRNKGVLRRSE